MHENPIVSSRANLAGLLAKSDRGSVSLLGKDEALMANAGGVQSGVLVRHLALFHLA